MALKLSTLLLVYLVIAENLSASIDLLTIDSFKITSMGAHSLLVSKKSDTSDSKAVFLFIMERPFCLCKKVSFVQHTPDFEDFVRPEEDTFTNGTMRVDFKKAQQVEFEVFIARPNKTTNIIEPQNFPSIRDAKIVEIQTVYGKERFILEGFKDVMRQATEMCKSYIPYVEDKAESKDMKT